MEQQFTGRTFIATTVAQELAAADLSRFDGRMGSAQRFLRTGRYFAAGRSADQRLAVDSVLACRIPVESRIPCAPERRSRADRIQCSIACGERQHAGCNLRKGS